MKEVTAVLKTGLDKLLADYNDRYTGEFYEGECVDLQRGKFMDSAVDRN